MEDQTTSTSQDLILADASVQEIQLELIRRASPGLFDGEKVVASLLAHRDLWEAVMIDRFCFSNPGKLPSMGLIKLRDLSQDFYNADTLYILTPDAESAGHLAKIIEDEDWGGMVLVHADKDDVERALGGFGREAAVVSVWWD